MSLILQGSTSGSVTLQEPAVAGTTVLTLPAISGNVVVDSATQTLTNKTIEGGTVMSGTAVASTSGTSIDFTSIPSWVKRITVLFNGVSTNGGTDLLIQIGAGGVTTTGYTGSSTSTIGTTIGSSNYTTGYGIRTGGSSGSSMVRQGSCTICSLGSNIWIESGVFSQSNEASNIYSAGAVSLGGTLDRVRITTVGGDTFDAGSINILYE